MKKTIIRTLVVAILIGFSSCQSTVEKSAKGVVFDASMNTIFITDAYSGDTLVFSTNDATKTATDGILIGDTAQVFFKGDLSTGLSATPMVATKVIVTSAVSPLFGSWVEPIPGMDGVQGIKFDKAGIASSVNMSTLVYETWKLDGNNITITGKSIGNGQTIDFTQIAKIQKLDADSLVYIVDDMTYRYAKQK